MEGGKSQSSQERNEAPRVKQLKIGHQSKGKESDAQTAQSKGKGIETQSLPSTWLFAPMLHGGPLLETASIRDLGDGEDGYMADALERTMLCFMGGHCWKLRPLGTSEMARAVIWPTH